MPAVGVETFKDVFCEGYFGISVYSPLSDSILQVSWELVTNRDVIIIVDHDEISQLQMTGCAGSLTSDTFHRTPIPKKAESVIIDEVESILIELGSRVSLGNCKADGICETLAKRTSSHLNARSILSFRMAGRDAVDLLRSESPSQPREFWRIRGRGVAYPESLQVIQCDPVAEKM